MIVSQPKSTSIFPGLFGPTIAWASSHDDWQSKTFFGFEGSS